MYVLSFQEMLAAFEKKTAEQTQQIELLEVASRSNEIVDSMDQTKMSIEIASDLVHM